MTGITAWLVASAVVVAAPMAEAGKPKRIGSRVALTGFNDDDAPARVEGKITSRAAGCTRGRRVTLTVAGERVAAKSGSNGSFALEHAPLPWLQVGVGPSYPFAVGEHRVVVTPKRVGPRKRRRICKPSQTTLTVEDLDTATTTSGQDDATKTFSGTFVLEPPCDIQREWAYAQILDGAPVLPPLLREDLDPVGGAWSYTLGGDDPASGEFAAFLLPAYFHTPGPGRGLTITQCHGRETAHANFEP